MCFPLLQHLLLLLVSNLIPKALASWPVQDVRDQHFHAFLLTTAVQTC